MPKGRKVGDVYVEFGADNTKLKKGLSDAEQQAEKLADTGEKSSRRFGNSLSQAGKAAERLQSTVSKILIPAAVVASVSGLVRGIREAGKRAEELRKEAEATVKAFRDQTTELQRQVRGQSDLEASNQQIADARQAALDALNKNFETFYDNEQSGLDTLRRKIGEVAGLFPTIEERAEEYSNAVEAIFSEERRQREANEQAIAKARAEAEKQAAEASAERSEAMRQEAAELRAVLETDPGMQAAIRRQELNRQEQKALRNAASEEEKRAIRELFDLRNKLLTDELRQRVDAAKQEGDAIKKAAEDAHRDRMRQIEEESRKRMKALDDYLKRQQEGFDRNNAELIVTMKGIQTAVQAIGRNRGDTIVLGGGA